ncbi:hypothetical protein RLPCCGM1_p1435 [Rhizobium leguminosarum bv. phaseoli CCGM1]|nr:hypothetical protein RLPCCGM1_p1435 [Rhizobium leguminosarum bv. phaseoli CCGM1]
MPYPESEEPSQIAIFSYQLFRKELVSLLFSERHLRFRNQSVRSFKPFERGTA